ncbi:peroxiredoxin [Virgibacillus natechei]|uniref:Peroxiredoxin n=1 Tax=Virgibacillus natechei TaxID=1216297 RepID=A0ABS4IFG2_9BACI|nr:thiol-disulfide oxidoreductase ResA [Virgibacillus natechei]MBP1969645.1 peroxiredoxin [Virgibacillus natechei]UZD11373.1 thiol-disulfide oxidoreductase ResA [Virgibacillus natechei]
MSLDQIKKKKKNKKRNRLIFRSAILAVLLVAVVFALVSNFQQDNTIYSAGDEAPDFELEQVNENNEVETIQLSELEGKGVMLNFWGTWCEPCKDEMPYMEELYPEYKDKGVEIVAVSLDATTLVIDRFIDDFGLTFPIPHDTTGEIMDLYKVGPIPSTFFINPNGEIEEVVNGALTLERLEGHLQDIQPEL